MKLDLSIQIINYNTKKYLAICLESILNDLKKSTLKFSISILNNNSKEDLADLKDKFKQKNIFFYSSKKNLGFGGGHDYLAQRSKYLKSSVDYFLEKHFKNKFRYGFLKFLNRVIN
jgi:GT2 family glycosyltransferase